VVERFEPFHLTTEAFMKFVPFTVRVKAEPPAVSLVGLKLVVVGTGLFMVNVWALDDPPPGVGLTTITLAVPFPVMSDAGTVALSCVPDT
jgi:hypothetical protein